MAAERSTGRQRLAWNWELLAALSGILFVVTTLVAFILSGGDKEISDAAGEVVSSYRDDRTKILVGAVLFGLALIFFFWFLGGIVDRMRAAGEGTLAGAALASGTAMMVLVAVGIAIDSALAYTVSETAGANLVKALSDFKWVVFVFVSFPAALLVATVSFTTVRTGMLPEWFGLAGLVVAAIEFLGGTTWARDGFWAPDGFYGVITVLAFLLWALVASVLLLQRARAGDRSFVARAAT